MYIHEKFSIINCVSWNLIDMFCSFPLGSYMWRNWNILEITNPIAVLHWVMKWECYIAICSTQSENLTHFLRKKPLVSPESLFSSILQHRGSSSCRIVTSKWLEIKYK